MGKKVNTTEQDIVRDIISCKFRKNQEERNQLIAKIIAFGLNNLSDEYFVNSVDLKVEDSKNIRYRGDAYIDIFDSVMNINPRTLTSRNGYCNDMLAIFHEVMHFADSVGNIRKIEGVYNNKHSFEKEELVSLVLRYSFGLGEYYSVKTLPRMQQTARMSREVREYWFAKYFTNPCEVMARRFSYDMMEKIVDIAKEDVGCTTILQWANLKELSNTLQKNKDYDYSKMEICHKWVDQYEDQFVQICKGVRQCLFAKDCLGHNAFDRCLRECDADQDSLRRNLIFKDALISLVYDYDDDCANVLMESCLSADNIDIDEDMPCALALCAITDFRPNQDQKERLLRKYMEKDEDVKNIVDKSCNMEIV